MTIHAILDACRALAPDIRARGEEMEHARRLSPWVVEALSSQGVFRLLLPPALGGQPLSLRQFFLLLESLAQAEAAVAWCVGNNLLTSLACGKIAPEAAASLFQAPNTITCGVLAPLGAAHEVDGGYRVTGRWPYASGSEYSALCLLGTVVHRDGQPLRTPDGAPVLREMLVPMSSLTRHDTWTVSGLCATGSHDLSAQDLFVPKAHSLVLVAPRSTVPGEVHQAPLFGVFGASIAACALGLAQAALDVFLPFAGQKTPRGGRSVLAESEITQTKLAALEGERQAARAFMLQTLDRASEALSAGGEIPMPDRISLRLASMNAVRASVSAVDTLYNLSGGGAIYAKNPIQRQFRDIHALTQHFVVSTGTDILLGRALLGLPFLPQAL